MAERDLEELIRERAFMIWIEQGQPDGLDRQYWEQAEAELVSGTVPAQTPVEPIGQISQAQKQTNKQAEEPMAPVSLGDLAPFLSHASMNMR
jgi:hypothetical protein